MDPWNPWIAETHVKRVPLWKLALVMVVSIGMVLAATWGATVVIFSLGRAT